MLNNRFAMSSKDVKKDAEGPLPTGWAVRKTKEGRVYYVNHLTKSTQWTRPASDPAAVVEEEEKEPEVADETTLAHVFSSTTVAFFMLKRGNLRGHVEKAATRTLEFLTQKEIPSTGLETLTASMNEFECNIAIGLKHPSVVTAPEAEEGPWQFKIFGHTGGIVMIKKASLVQKTRKYWEEFDKWRRSELPHDQAIFVGSCSNEFHHWIVVFWRPRLGDSEAAKAGNAAE